MNIAYHIFNNFEWENYVKSKRSVTTLKHYAKHPLSTGKDYT